MNWQKQPIHIFLNETLSLFISPIIKNMIEPNTGRMIVIEVLSPVKNLPNCQNGRVLSIYPDNKIGLYTTGSSIIVANCQLF